MSKKLKLGAKTMNDSPQKKDKKLLVTPHHLLVGVSVCVLLLGGIAYLQLSVDSEDRGWKAIVWAGAIVLLLVLEFALLKVKFYRDSFMTRPIEKQEDPNI